MTGCTFSSRSFVADGFVDQVRAFAVTGDQNAITARSDAGAAADLLYQIRHEARLLARRQVLLDGIRIGNRRADDLKLLLRFFHVLAVRKIPDDLLVKLRGFVRLFFFRNVVA